MRKSGVQRGVIGYEYWIGGRLQFTQERVHYLEVISLIAIAQYLDLSVSSFLATILRRICGDHLALSDGHSSLEQIGKGRQIFSHTLTTHGR